MQRRRQKRNLLHSPAPNSTMQVNCPDFHTPVAISAGVIPQCGRPWVVSNMGNGA